MEYINKLYEIDNRAESLAERAELRKTESTAEIDAFSFWLRSVMPVKGTNFQKAVTHTLSIW